MDFWKMKINYLIRNRIDHLQLSVSSLRDYVTQMREAYQSQIDIEQNHIMKVFTLITAIFLPLTLMVGWYGMNFKHMYELNSPYSYPIFILISILVCISLVIYYLLCLYTFLIKEKQTYNKAGCKSNVD